MKSPEDVQVEYDQFKQLSPDTQLDITGFAQQMDQLDGKPDRETVYKNKWYHKLDRGVDAVFDWTPSRGNIMSPAELGESAMGGLGGLVDKGLGTTKVEGVFSQIGRDLPRMTAEGLATIPMAAVPGVGEVGVGAMWANRLRKLGQVAGYAGAALKSGAQTDSLAGAAMGAGAMFGANKLLLPTELGGAAIGRQAENKIVNWLEKNKPNLTLGEKMAPTGTASRILGPLANVGTDVAAMTGLNEVTRQGMMSVGPNAVGLDPARNPLTEENIAANVGGSLMFAPQMISGLRNPARIAPKQERQLLDYITAKDEIMTAADTPSKVPTAPKVEDPTTVIPTDLAKAATMSPEQATNPSRSDALFALFKETLENARQAEEDGDPIRASQLYSAVVDVQQEIVKRGGIVDPRAPRQIVLEKIVDERFAQHAAELAVEGRLSGPVTHIDLVDYTARVKSLIDNYNKQEIEHVAQVKSREETLNRNDKNAVAAHEEWLRQEEAKIGVTRYPNARDQLVVEQLWSRGKLRPLTPEWIAAELAATMESNHNPDVARRLVAQKVANYMMVKLPEAQAADAATRQAGPAPLDATAQSTVRAGKLKQWDEDFIRSIGALPVSKTKRVQPGRVDKAGNPIMASDYDMLLARTIEQQRDGNYPPESAAKLGITEGVRTDPNTKLQMTSYPNWQAAVVRAMKTFDPETGTIELMHKGKLLKRVPMEHLWAKNEAGDYLWRPTEVRLQTAGGGKPTSGGRTIHLFDTAEQAATFAREQFLDPKVVEPAGKRFKVETKEAVAKEQSIEALPTKEARENVGALDEELIKQRMAEEGGEGLSEGDTDAMRLAMTEGMGEAEPTKPDFVDERQVRAEIDMGKTMEKRKELIRRSLDSLDDRQLWSLAMGDFKFRETYGTNDQKTFKRENLRLALTAALENLYSNQATGLSESGRAFFAKMREHGNLTSQSSDTETMKMFLRSFFQDKNPVPGMSGDLSNSTQRVVRIVRKLLDPKIMEIVKNEGIVPEGRASRVFNPIITMDDIKQMKSAYRKTNTGQVLVSNGPGEGHVRFAERLGLTTDSLVRNKNGNEKALKGPWTIAGYDYGLSDANGRFYTIPELDTILKNGPTSGRLSQNSTGPLKLENDVFTNSPHRGSFATDVERTVRSFSDEVRLQVDDQLARRGLSGTSKEFLVEVAVALSQQMDMNGANFYRLVVDTKDVAGGYALPVDKTGRMAVGLNVAEMPQTGSGILHLLDTLSHEVIHMDQFIAEGLVPKPDVVSDRRKTVLENFKRFAETLELDERVAMLEIVNEVLPAPLRTSRTQADGMPYGSHDVNEFTAEFNARVVQALVLDTPAGRKVVAEMMDYMPQAVREMSRDTANTIYNLMSSMKDAMLDSNSRFASPPTDSFIMTHGFDALVESARAMTTLRHADQALAISRSFIDTLTPGGGVRPPVSMTDAIWSATATELEKNIPDPTGRRASAPLVSEEAMAALREVEKAFSPVAYNQSMKPSLFAEWVYPFSQLMVNQERMGVTLARDVMNTVFSMEPSIARMYSGMMKDFLKPNQDGTYSFNAEHPMVRAITSEPNGKWRKGVNIVSKWQQMNDTVTMFVTDEKGMISVNKNAKGAVKMWDKVRKTLTPDEQQTVMAVSTALDKSSQVATKYLLTSIKESNTGLLATFLMAANKKLTHDRATRLAGQVHEAYLSGNTMALKSLLPEQQLTGINRLLVGTASEKAPLGDGLLAKYYEVSERLTNRPGFRSESLPHKWIIKYKDGDKTQYASAPLERQAHALADRLRSEGKVIIGEILPREKINAITEFDNPDAILAKVAETERYTYEKFVSEMEVTHGAEFAKELREGYTPVGQAAKEMGVNSMNKFLRERRSLVDAREFDYIDGQMAYLQRLSSSLAMRGVQQQMRLVLNDPRARLLPSFQKLVRSHVTEMMQPRSEFHQKASAFTTTWFLGAGLASAVVNGTQSMTTLVPWLISGIDNKYPVKGGPIKAWKDMTQAMGNATWVSMGKDWQRIATIAKTKSPATWTANEAMAASFRRHVENGGIAMTVIDDLMYGRDQNMLRLARFGHGDYGPTGIGNMVKDKVYIGSQMLMSLFKAVEHFNAKTSFLAGIKQGHELGLIGDELYNYGVRMQSLSTFGGGRSNAPGIVSGGRNLKEGVNPLRTGFGLANALQQYGYGVLAMYGQLGKDMFHGSRELTPVQRIQAAKSFGTMLMTQTAVAGVMGLPFAGAMLTILEQQFGIPATQAIREGLASMSDDKETGAVIAETAMNGFGNQMTGMDVSSRMGVNSIFGTSSYKGFDVRDMFGPLPSVIANAAESLNLFGQNKPIQAARQIVPIAFRNALEMADTKARYGDAGFRDSAGNLMYMPTSNEQVGYALGVRPAVLSKKRQAQQMFVNANARTNDSMDRRYDVAAEALNRGDPAVAQRMAQEAIIGDPTVDPTEVLRSIMNRALNLTNEKDMLASGSRWNEDERLGIMATFGDDVNTRRSEVDLQKQRMQIARQLRDPALAPTMDSFMQAAMVDKLVASGKTRSQAVRLVAFMTSDPTAGY